jgi:hypothetical protein
MIVRDSDGLASQRCPSTLSYSVLYGSCARPSRHALDHRPSGVSDVSTRLCTSREGRGLGGVAVASAAGLPVPYSQAASQCQCVACTSHFTSRRAELREIIPRSLAAQCRQVRGQRHARRVKGRRGRGAGRQAGRRREFGVGLNMCLSISPTPGLRES